MAEIGIIQLAYTLDFCANQTAPRTLIPIQKEELLESSVPMTQQDINEILTVLNTPPSPSLGEFGQPAFTSQDLYCSRCNVHGHIVEACPVWPTLSKLCYHCGESGH